MNTQTSPVRLAPIRLTGSGSDRSTSGFSRSEGAGFDGRVGTLVTMSGRSGAPFSYADIRPYEVAESLSELRGSEHGVVTLPLELAWGGRTEFDLDDDYDRAAVYKIVLEEGNAEHLWR